MTFIGNMGEKLPAKKRGRRRRRRRRDNKHVEIRGSKGRIKP